MTDRIVQQNTVAKKPNLAYTRGFTLIELIVALGLFTVVVTVAGGAFYAMSEANRSVQNTRAVIDNLNLSMEEIARTMRTGVFYVCNPVLPAGSISAGSDCPLGGDSVAFISSEGQRTVYRLAGTSIEKSTDGGLSFTALTAPDLRVEDLSFFVSGNAGTLQPRAIIVIKGMAGVAGKGSAQFSLQTSVTQRIPK